MRGLILATVVNGSGNILLCPAKWYDLTIRVNHMPSLLSAGLKRVCTDYGSCLSGIIPCFLCFYGYPNGC